MLGQFKSSYLFAKHVWIFKKLKKWYFYIAGAGWLFFGRIQHEFHFSTISTVSGEEKSHFQYWIVINDLYTVIVVGHYCNIVNIYYNFYVKIINPTSKTMYLLEWGFLVCCKQPPVKDSDFCILSFLSCLNPTFLSERWGSCSQFSYQNRYLN